MPWCKQCKAEYRDGFTECSDCGLPLVDEKPEAAEEDYEEIVVPMPEQEMTLLVSVLDSGEAKRLQQLLESYEIPVIFTDADTNSPVANVDEWNEREIQLLVPQIMAGEAMNILLTEDRREEKPDEAPFFDQDFSEPDEELPVAAELMDETDDEEQGPRDADELELDESDSKAGFKLMLVIGVLMALFAAVGIISVIIKFFM